MAISFILKTRGANAAVISARRVSMGGRMIAALHVTGHITCVSVHNFCLLPVLWTKLSRNLCR